MYFIKKGDLVTRENVDSWLAQKKTRGHKLFLNNNWVCKVSQTSEKTMKQVAGQATRQITPKTEKTTITEVTKKKKQRSEVVNLSNMFMDHCGLEKTYRFSSEQHLAAYAVTNFIKSYGLTARNSLSFKSRPTVQDIKTDINQTTTVFQNVTAFVSGKINGCPKQIQGMIQAVQYDESYRVYFSARTNEELVIMESAFESIIEHSNFFQGKSLRFSRNGVVFIPTPRLSMEDAVLPERITKEYALNVVDFLTDDKYHDITMKRALLLYGPPGSGKTTSLKALFSILRKKKVTCMYLTDDTFQGTSLENVFDFINKYLTPALIGFEDIDLIGEDRRSRTGIIGSLLSVLNGVEDYQKPIVIIGTTNRLDILDDAVTRPCRFDRKLFIDYPTTEALRKMFKNIMGFAPPSNTIRQSSDKKNKLTGAHIKEICDTARILARKNNDVPIQDCVAEAVEIIKDSFYLATSSVGFGGMSCEGEVDKKYPIGCDSGKSISSVPSETSPFSYPVDEPI